MTTLTTVSVACAVGHSMRRRYGDIRKRGCPECKEPFGERLLYAFLRHYATGPDDWQRMVVRGLDPKDANRKVVFDAASPIRKFGLENHSAYHDPNQNVPIFQRIISKKERLRLDRLKVPQATNGKHRGGPLDGWHVGVLWFEAARLARLSDGSGSYLSIAIQEFKHVARSIGLKLREDGVEINAAEVYAGLGRDALAGIGREFHLLGPWRGRTFEHRWRHSCGGEFNKVIRELESRPPGKSGCPFCDREGVCGRWLAFLERLEQHGYCFAGKSRYRICTEHQVVQLRCVVHPAGRVRRLTRSKLYQWLDGLKAGATKALPPPCLTCRAAYTRDVQFRERQRREAERQRLGRRLEAFGFTLVTMLPTSVRDPATGKIRTQKNKIRCKRCGHVWSIFVVQQLAKAEKRGRMGCPRCSPLKKGPKADGATC
ncbi:hypothetical protein OH764_00775 [Burkholderia sp. M6-3]